MAHYAKRKHEKDLSQSLSAEIARLRDLDGVDLQTRWRTVFRQKAPPHLSRNLLFRILAYEAQRELFGDLAREYGRLLDRLSEPGGAHADAEQRRTKIQKGAILSREWKGRIHRISVLSDGFAWNGRTYSSLTKAAFAITGTRWNGPRFFGLRDRKSPTT
jgi:hypothetical protein